MSVVDVGAQVSFGGLLVGSHWDFGPTANQWNLAPKGASNQKSGTGGVSYTIGPVVAGVQYMYNEHAGNWNQADSAFGTGKLMTEKGIAVGGTLTVAPGAYLFVDYLYGHRHQAGTDILSGAVSSAANGFVTTNNNVRSQAFFVGTMFRW